MRRLLSSATAGSLKQSFEKQQSLANLSNSILLAKDREFTPELCSLAFQRVGEICHKYNRPAPDVQVLDKLIRVTCHNQAYFTTAQQVHPLILGLARSGWVIGGGEDDQLDKMLLKIVPSHVLNTFSLKELLQILAATGELKSISPNEELQFVIARAIASKPDFGGLELKELSVLMFTFQHDLPTLRRLECELANRKDLSTALPLELFEILHLLMEKDVELTGLEAISQACLNQGLAKVDTSLLFLVLSQLDRLQLVPTQADFTRAILRELSVRGAPLFLGGFAQSKRYIRTLQRIRQCRDPITNQSVLEGENLLHPNFSRVTIVAGLSTFYVLFILDGGILGVF
ncbi:hypothetical protein BASA81_009839 [Batrachochytrium salamandrivorans]|nr:hypothetical protein BASA81_009839 [Batrachochytrium salamandrivorans]